MSLSYEDKRARYKGMSPADFVPGTPKHDNPVKVEPKAPVRAFRDGTAPRDKFRVATAPPPPEPPPVPEPPPYVEPVPAAVEIESVYGNQPGTKFDGLVKNENEI